MASIRTHAEDRGDHFVVNGEKMWCTGAGLPNTLLAMYVRTDREAPPREGISLLIVDPTAPGVTVQRIPTLARNILGTNSVSFSDVVIPRDRLVGELNGGWSSNGSSSPVGTSVPPRRRSRRPVTTPRSASSSGVASVTSRRWPTSWPTSEPTSRPLGCSPIGPPG